MSAEDDWRDLYLWVEAQNPPPLLWGDFIALLGTATIGQTAQALTRKVAHDHPRYAGRWESTAQGWADGWNACLKALFPEQLDLWPEPPEAA